MLIFIPSLDATVGVLRPLFISEHLVDLMKNKHVQNRMIKYRHQPSYDLFENRVFSNKYNYGMRKNFNKYRYLKTTFGKLFKKIIQDKALQLCRLVLSTSLLEKMLSII